MISPAPIQTAPTNKQTGLTALPWVQWFNQVANGVGGSWQNWTPTASASGSMTVSGLSVGQAEYLLMGAVVEFYVRVGFTLGGTASTDVLLSLPVALAEPDFVPATAIGTPAGLSQQNMLCFVNGSSLLVRLSPIANWPLGAQFVRISGAYRCL